MRHPGSVIGLMEKIRSFIVLKPQRANRLNVFVLLALDNPWENGVGEGSSN